VEIFYKMHFNLAAQWRATYLCFLFYFLGICVLFNFTIFKMDGWFCRMLGNCSKGQVCAALLLYELRLLMEWRCNGVKGSWGTNAWNGMHRNERSYRKHICFPLSEWWGYVEWGKGVTDEISKKCLAAFRVLSNCTKRWHFCVSFINTKKYGWQCRCQYTKAIAWVLLILCRHNACLRVLLVATCTFNRMVSSYQKAQA